MSGFDRAQAETKRATKMKKETSPCRADAQGGSFLMIPKCLIDSPAYRDLSLHARAVLVEITARMGGFNNGKIAVSNRELVEALRCSPRAVVTAIKDLIDHGMIDVEFEGQWHARKARQYRLTFVHVDPVNKRATNDYLRWNPQTEKSSVTDAVADKGKPASDAVARGRKPATDAVTEKIIAWRKSVDHPQIPASDVVALISKPCSPAPEGQCKGDNGSLLGPLSTSALERASEASPINGQGGAGNGTDRHDGCRTCEDCGREFDLDRPDRAKPRRFCSETCRKRAEGRRAYERRKHESEPTPIGSILNGLTHRMVAGGSA